MRRCDVLIVGAGPAGSSCAWRLVRKGFDVVMLDQARFPRDKTCGGWITPVVLELLEIDARDYSQSRVLQPITGFRVSCGTAPAVRVPFGKIVSYGIRRFEFDDFLQRRSGAQVCEGVRAERIERDGTSWVVNGQFSAPLLIGAGGHFCPVARTLGAQVTQEPAVIAQEVEWQGRTIAEPTEPHLCFFTDRSGYAWSFQKQKFANVGLGCLGPKSLAPYRPRFFAWLRSAGTAPSDPPPLHGHAYLTADHSPRQVAGESVMLVGDSAGLADSRSGEGIRPAVESGLLAARFAIEAKGAYTPERFARYAAALTAPRSRSAFSWPVPEALSLKLMSIPWFVREFVVKRWFLHMNQPRLIADRG
jgi:menaquinone-9 beta-reductase